MGNLEHCTPPAYAYAFSAPLLLVIAGVNVFDVAFLCPGRYERARAALRPRQGHPHREAERFSRIRAPDHALCAGHAVARSPGGSQPILHSGDGSRWPRRNGGIVANEHPEGDLNTALARTVPLGGACGRSLVACALLPVGARRPLLQARVVLINLALSGAPPEPRVRACILAHRRSRKVYNTCAAAPAREHREDGKAMQPRWCAFQYIFEGGVRGMLPVIMHWDTRLCKFYCLQFAP